MNIVAFCGSPRKNGNTELLLKEAIKGVESGGFSTTSYYLNSMHIQPCQDCGGCNETGECIYRDDMDRIYDAIRSAHRIILASPIFFFALSAQSKLMIDRCQCLWVERYLLKKTIDGGRSGRKGLLLLVGGMKKDIGVKCSETCATAFFRSVSVPEHNVLSYLGIDEKGAILSHPTALKDAFEAGRKLVTGDVDERKKGM